MSSKHSSNDSNHQSVDQIIDEKSIQDKVLSVLAVLSLLALLILGFYWQSLPLPAVQANIETKE